MNGSIQSEFSNPWKLFTRIFQPLEIRGLVAVILILGMTGGHWMLLQSVAWAKMLVDYSRASSLRVAVEQTFDGRHPCAMCKAIQKARQPAKQQELQPPAAQDNVLYVEAHVSDVFDPPCSRMPGITGFAGPTCCDPPPVPPPKFPACS
jgi:hypothetical protein